MAFTNVKYQSDFYNHFGTLVSVKIYEDSYAGGITNIRTKSVTIDWNYVDENTPVAGTGAKVSFVNSGDFNDFDDLLTGYEKTFKCVIEYNSVVVFEGYNICDLNEQQLLDKAIITVQFTNYLRRLEDKYLTELTPISNRTLLLDAIQEALEMTGLLYDLYVNSTLWESHMNDDDEDTWLNNTYVENDVFYENPDEYDDVYTSLNKMLKSFGAFLYAYGQKWVIERFSNITRIGTWVLHEYGSNTGKSTTSLKQSINKQNGDFKYVESSQICEYNSGLNTLIVDILDKTLDTLCFNDWDAATITTVADDIPDGGTLTKRTWYTNANNTGLEDGILRGKTTHWFLWNNLPTVDFQWRAGLYYVFDVQFNASLPTNLTVNFKNELDTTSGRYDMWLRYFIKVNSGVKVDWFLAKAETGELYLREEPYAFETKFSGENVKLSTEVNDIWALDDIAADLGSPAIQDFMIGFLPQYIQTGGGWGYSSWAAIGDIIVKIDPESVTNKITTTFNESFTKTETVELNLFDLNNYNYNNGLMYNATGSKTSGWDEGGDSVYDEELVDLYIKNKLRKYNRTVHKLKAKILTDIVLKPFCIITDDNLALEESSGSIIDFVLTSDTWDLVNGMHDIEAEEFPDTEIILEDV
jgi:hypothetical protein